jgi:hypothetical protein
MAIVDIMCPACGEDMSVPARALLATIDLGHQREPLGQLSWVCLSCDDLVVADIELVDLLLLLSVGVLVVDDAFGAGTRVQHWTDDWPLPLQDEGIGGNPAFTPADVQVLRELLDTDTWFQLFGKRRDGR